MAASYGYGGQWQWRWWMITPLILGLWCSRDGEGMEVMDDTGSPPNQPVFACICGNDTSVWTGHSCFQVDWVGLEKNNPMWKGQRRSNRSTFACHRMSFFNSVWTFVLCVLRFLRNGYRCDQVVLSSQVALKRQQWPADSRSACSWRHALDSSSMPCDMATIWFVLHRWRLRHVPGLEGAFVLSSVYLPPAICVEKLDGFPISTGGFLPKLIALR